MKYYVLHICRDKYNYLEFLNLCLAIDLYNTNLYSVMLYLHYKPKYFKIKKIKKTKKTKN